MNTNDLRSLPQHEISWCPPLSDAELERWVCLGMAVVQRIIAERKAKHGEL